jgi:hypothetical protein
MAASSKLIAYLDDKQEHEDAIEINKATVTVSMLVLPSTYEL